MPQQLGQQGHDVGAHHNLAMLRTKKLSHSTGIRQLVVESLCFAASKTNGVSADRLLRMPGHETDHRARIDAAGEECSNRNITDHLHAHRLFNLHADTIDPVTFGKALIDARGKSPIAPLAHLTVFNLSL